jgi:hypothetical protein
MSQKEKINAKQPGKIPGFIISLKGTTKLSYQLDQQVIHSILNC